MEKKGKEKKPEMPKEISLSWILEFSEGAKRAKMRKKRKKDKKKPCSATDKMTFYCKSRSIGNCMPGGAGFGIEPRGEKIRSKKSMRNYFFGGVLINLIHFPHK